jgi:DNA polymerase-3 subunit epsilon/CBS domain-containing protein
VADILHETGVPYCRGGVMARNPQWRGSLATWRDRIADWIKRSRPGDLLAVDIFFDMLGVHGEPAVAEALWRGAFDAGHGETRFAKLLAEAAGPAEPGLGLFGRFKTVQGRIDLKRTGLFPIATMARVLAIHHHVVERSTLARLAGIKALGLGGQRDLDALAEAHGVFLELILAQQIDDVDCGMPPTNAVAVKRLSRHERERLGSALRATAYLDELTRALLFTG